MPYDPVTGQIVPIYDPYTEAAGAFMAPISQVATATARSRAAKQALLAQQKERISSTQQQLYQQSQNNRDILADKSFRDPYSWEGEYMPPMVKGQDNLSENLEQRYGKDTERLKRFEAANAMILDANGYAPGAASAPAGPPSDPAQAARDRQAADYYSSATGSPSKPFKIEDATIQTLGTTPDPKQGPPKTAAQIDSANRWKDIGAQAGIAAIIGGLQVGSAFIPTEAQKLARETVDEWGGDAPEKYGDQVRKQFYEEGVSRLNLQAGRGREVQEDIAASAGNVDAGAQQDIRNAMMSAFTVGEAELQANATALGLEAAKEKTAKYNSAVAYVSQIRTARGQAVENLLKGLAPVAAQFGVNRGIEVMSPDIAKLDPQYQDMFYNLSSGAKDQTELARAYAYVQRSSEKAAQAAAKAAADAATTQAATP